MSLPEIHIDHLASRKWERAWRAHERRLRRHIRAMYAQINDAIRRAALRDLGREPAPDEVRSMGRCLVHKDGRREYVWNGRTIAVMHPWAGGEPPWVEIFEP